MDWSEVLERLGGDRELLLELAQIFLDNIPKMMADIERAISDQELPALQIAAHSLKGAAGNFGAKALVDLALALENMAGAGEIQGAQGTYDALKLEMEDFAGHLRGLQ